MSATLRKAPARREWLVIAAVVGLACLCAAALDVGVHGAGEALETPVSPLPALSVRCRFAGAEALLHARALEQMARARWERVPFAIEEAPRAYLQMGEAELCYGVRDRAGRLRAAATRREYQQEIERSFARARLLLRVALRDERLDQARQHIATLTALLERAPDASQAFRAELQQLDRTYAAELSELAEEDEE